MNKISINGKHLLCPFCDFDYVHIDDVYVLGRAREDGPTKGIHVDHKGDVHEDAAVPGWSDRRHAISIGGSCEECHAQFAINFIQHKGQTEVTVSRHEWQTVG